MLSGSLRRVYIGFITAMILPKRLKIYLEEKELAFCARKEAVRRLHKVDHIYPSDNLAI